MNQWIINQATKWISEWKTKVVSEKKRKWMKKSSECDNINEEVYEWVRDKQWYFIAFTSFVYLMYTQKFYYSPRWDSNQTVY